MKKLLVSNLIIMICFSAFMLGYSSLEGVSFADTEIEWENCTTAEEQAEAFKAYCKSRDVTIEGSIADGVTSFTTQTYQNLVNTLGLDINALQADIKKTTDSSGTVKFLFNASGISAMNRIFSQFLQDHDLEVGDSANQQDNTIYDGELFVDIEGNKCIVYSINNSTGTSSNKSTFIVQDGTFYKYQPSDYARLYSNGQTSVKLNITENDNNINYNLFTTSDNSYTLGFLAITAVNTIPLCGYAYSNKVKGSAYGSFIIGKNSGRYYLCAYSFSENYTNSSEYRFTNIRALNTSSINISPCIIYIYSPTINNNDYSNNTYTTINNDGDVYNYDTDDEPDPDTPVTPPDPPTPDDPSGGNPPDDWDIELPDLSNTDWVIYGLEKKFPWDIPFNMMFILSLLNTEPVTPHFEGTIDLKVCQWNYDLDLSPFDTIAGYVRDFLFLGFIIGLMLMTKNLIWG